MMLRIADWHGEQAAIYYQKWVRTDDETDLRDYARHAALADRMWESLGKRKNV